MKSLNIVAGLMLALTTFSHSISTAQDIDWEKVPKVHAIPDSFSKEAAIFVLDKRRLQVVNENKSIYTYRTLHRIIHIETEKGLEYFNTMTVGVDAGNELVSLYARTIKANGKVINIAADQIKQTKDEQNETEYHVAFEGVEVGDEVEIIVTERRSFSAFGIEIMQFGLPVMKASFYLETPSFLEFETKGYNGFPKAGAIELDDMRYYTAEAKNIQALDEEEYSDFGKNLRRLEYKLNHIGGKSERLYNWDNLAKKFEDDYASFNAKELRSVQNFLEANGINMQDRELQKIRKIEALLKSTFVYQENLNDEQYKAISFILDKKVTSEVGIVRLFMAAFQAMGVQAQLGVTSNRFNYQFDPEFENWNVLDIYLIYLPGIKEYLAPSFMTYRCPMIPAASRGNKGAFSVGSSTNTKSEIKEIPQLPYVKSNHGLEAHIKFDEEQSVIVDAVHIFSGYSASSIREAFVYVEKEKEIELVQSLVSLAEQKEALVKYEVENAALEHYADEQPLLIKSTIKAPQIVETAGKKLLLKVGDVLGPQAQLYNDEKRVLPISMPFPHMLSRKIVIDIPQGYNIANPNVVNMNVTDKGQTMGFISEGKIQGNTMTISINEYYSQTDYPASEIDAFKSVINAAADFNKITLVLEPK